MTNTDLMNVNAFENQLPDAAFASLNPQDESLADGIGQSYGIVGYKGKVWTLRYRGETYTVTRADDGSPAAFLDVIVLRSAPYRSKSWYEGGYQEGMSGQRPTCSSLDGVAPDHDVPKRQAEACAICPKNEFKVNANGRKGKDCSDYKRLAVLLLPSVSTRLLGSALMEPVFLRVPAASLNDLAMLGEAMQKKGFHYSTYITRIGFDPEKPHPQMVFRAIQKLTDKEAPLVLPMREDPTAYRVTGENEVGKSRPSGMIAGNGGQLALQHTAPASTATPAPTTTVQTAAPKSAPAEKQPEPTPTFHSNGVVVNDEIAELERKLAAARAASNTNPKPAAVQVQPRVQPASETVDTGFAVAMENPRAGGNGAEVVGFGAAQTVVEAGSTVANDMVADTGPAEESDADLDARVAGLLQR